MTNDLPEPFAPHDCDLRGYDFMPLFGHRLFRSELYEQASGEQFKIALKLWWEAWNQCPAGSLPNDEAKLIRLADLGRDTKTWKKVREIVLRGFVLCNDGRLYHRLLCDLAVEAFDRRLRDRERKRRWRESHDGGGNDGGSHASRPRSATGTETRRATGTNGIGDRDNFESHAPAPRSVRVVSLMRGEERTGEERRGEDLRKNLKELEGDENSRVSCVAGVGPEAASAVVTALKAGLRMTAYPPRKAARSPDEQRAAMEKPRPRTAHLTPEQLAIVRRRA